MSVPLVPCEWMSELNLTEECLKGGCCRKGGSLEDWCTILPAEASKPLNKVVSHWLLGLLVNDYK